MKTIRIGTRASKLALVQSEMIRDILMKNNPGLSVELLKIKTTGDKILDAPLSKIGDKGLFTKEIEKELLAGTVDLAVHSMKDMPTALPEGLTIGAVTVRLNPRDVFITRKGLKLADLKSGGTIATGSLRRRAQLMAFSPSLKILDIRGNVQSRLKKMDDNPVIDGMILACAGIERLGIQELISEIIPEEIITPAVGQASLAIEIRSGDTAIQKLIDPLNDPDSATAIGCERAFLGELGGGCQVPIAGYARVSNGTLTLNGMIASLDGSEVYRDTQSGPASEFKSIAKKLATMLLDRGGRAILEEIYGYSL